MIISFLSQKGGVTKSTLSRATAVAFAENKWSVHLIDLDWQQQTSFKWANRRDEANIKPTISASSVRRLDPAFKLESLYDLLIIDGRASSDKDSIVIAKKSDLIVLPTGTSLDDLEPQLNLARDFKNNGVNLDKIFFVINKSPTESESSKAIETIKAWGFQASLNCIGFKAAYSSAQDQGKSITETRYNSLNATTNNAVQDIVNMVS